MAAQQEIEDPRRRWLVRALGMGMLAGAIPQTALGQSVFGSRPDKLPKGRSIYRAVGDFSLNGKSADPSAQIQPGDTIRTGKGAELIFAVGGQAMIVRADSELSIEGIVDAVKGPILGALRLVTGKLLSVSRDTKLTITTPNATIGIRGTGWYAEADPEKTYFCTCYGTTEVSAVEDPNARETVVSKHHDRPLYVLAKPSGGKSILAAPFINHTDQELMLIEALVGREPPFVFPNDAYSGPRRSY
ncbi:MAG: FecR domain-containing protein [Burkholderiales bacterium]|nr:FecR domain-containing protein [Burkholderiales bacterium]